MPGDARQIKAPRRAPQPRPCHRPAKGTGTLVASHGAIRPRPRCAPLPAADSRHGVRGAFQGEAVKVCGGILFLGGGVVSPHLPAPLAQGQLPEAGSRLPLRAFLGEARGAERGWTWSEPCNWGEREEEKKEGEGARGGRGVVEKAARDPPSSPGPEPAPAGSPAPDRPGTCGGERGGRRDPPAPLHRRGPACGERNPSFSPPPSLPSLLPPSFLPSFSRLGPGREGGSACSLPSRLPARATPGSLLFPPRPPWPPPAAPQPPPAPLGPGEAVLPSHSDVGRRDPGWISGAS